MELMDLVRMVVDSGGDHPIVRGDPEQRQVVGGDLQRLQVIPGEIRIDENGQVTLVLNLGHENSLEGNNNNSDVP